MMNHDLAWMLVKAREEELLRDVGRRRLLEPGDEKGSDRWRALPAAARARERRLLLVGTRVLVHLADRLGCGRDELVRVIEGLS